MTTTTQTPREAAEAHARACRAANIACKPCPAYAGPSLVSVDLSSADLRGANLRGATLTGADLTGAARFISDNHIPGWYVVAGHLERIPAPPAAPQPPPVQSGTFTRPRAADEIPAFVRDMMTRMHSDLTNDWVKRGGWIVVRCWDGDEFTLTAAKIALESEEKTP